MQVAINGTYKNGQIVLDELPPNLDESREVMVVFLPKSSANEPNQDKDSKSYKTTALHETICETISREELSSPEPIYESGGIMEDYSNDINGYGSSTKKPDNKLYGMFAHYISEKITDDQIEDAITKGVINRAMLGKS